MINKSGQLEAKIVLVPGASQGFGRGILETFARAPLSLHWTDLQATDGLVEFARD